MKSIEQTLETLMKKAYKRDEVPVSAVIVHNNKIIAKAYNRKNKTNNPLHHAEIEAIKKASRVVHSWRLCNCKIYVTLEPCNMCRSVINESRIKEVYYYAKNTNVSRETFKSRTNYININNELSEKVQVTLKNFFKNRR